MDVARRGPRAAATAAAALRVFNDLTTMRPSPTNQAWADLGDLTAVVRP